MTFFQERDADIQAVSAGSVPVEGSGAGIWLVTFADLVLLLFAFFVMLFSMTTLETPVVERFRLGVLPTRAAPPVAVETTPARAEANIAAVDPPRAAATEYLVAVLQDALARVSTLRDVTLTQSGDSVDVRPPPALWAAARVARDGVAAGALGELALLLDRLENRIMVIATVPGTDVEAWDAGLARAAEAADALREAGFSRALDVRVHSAAPSGPAAGLSLLILGEREGS